MTLPAPDLQPRTSPLDLTPYGIPHPRPFIVDVSIAAESVSRLVNHVSNVEYLRWLDRAAELHADALGWTRTSLLEHGVMWFVARHEIDYLAEARPDDELAIATWVRDVRKVKSWRDYVIVRPADQAIITRAATLWVLVDLKTRRPRRIAGDMIDNFDPLECDSPHDASRPADPSPCTSR